MAVITNKKYKCDQCGHITEQATNHYGFTYNFGRYNVCPSCPPYKKYAEYGGRTVWECMEVEIITDKNQEEDGN